MYIDHCLDNTLFGDDRIATSLACTPIIMKYKKSSVQNLYQNIMYSRSSAPLSPLALLTEQNFPSKYIIPFLSNSWQEIITCKGSF